MNRITRALPVALLWGTLFAAGARAQGTYTAADCSQTSVNAVINGPTHTAVDGDVIRIPAGTCTWTSGITVPNGIGITIIGNGTPNSTSSTFGASASCSNTNITISGVTGFTMTPSYGNSTLTRLSCLLLQASGSAVAFKVLGSCTASGCPNLRVDNITFPSNWQGASGGLGNSYGISAIGDMFGVLDHNTINGPGGNYLQFVEFSHASYLGVGLWGDNSWAQPENYGSANFLFFENNTFTAAGTSENEGSAGAYEKEGGGRIVVRYNHFNNMDNVNASMMWHGTESSGRPRSGRAFEYYNNTLTCGAGMSCYVTGPRGGTGLAWGNTINLTGAAINSFMDLNTNRALANTNATWGPCDGSSVWDTNAGITYFDGTVASGGGTATITVSGSGGTTPPPWSNNQWIVNGSAYSVHDFNQSQGSEITANGSNTLTLRVGSGGPGDWAPSNGDHIQILRATACIDQGGGRGTGTLYTTANPAAPASPANQVVSPTYVWSNMFNGGTPNAIINPNTARVIRSRDFYVENLDQAAQSNSTTPFNGTNTIGIGHGTLANRPTSCTTGVGYFDTGANQLYRCTSTNTWTLFYTPYTYPHPLTTGAATGGTALAAPTGVIATVH